MIKSSVNLAAISFFSTLLFIVKSLIMSVYPVGNLIPVLFSTFVTMSEDAPVWALATLVAANVRNRTNDRKRILMLLSFFQTIAVSFSFGVPCSH